MNNIYKIWDKIPLNLLIISLVLPTNLSNFIQWLKLHSVVLRQTVYGINCFWSQHKCQNPKLGNLGNFQFPQLKKIHSNSEVLKNFGVFRVSNFSIRAKIENSETSEISNFLQQNNYKPWEKFRVFRVFDLSISAKIEN